MVQLKSSYEIKKAKKKVGAGAATYGRTDIFRVVTTDAGNTSLASASKTMELGYHYFAQVKSPNGEIFDAAVSELGEDRVQHTWSKHPQGRAATAGPAGLRCNQM